MHASPSKGRGVAWRQAAAPRRPLLAAQRQPQALRARARTCMLKSRLRSTGEGFDTRMVYGPGWDARKVAGSATNSSDVREVA
jgi:hypothetical protein